MTIEEDGRDDNGGTQWRPTSANEGEAPKGRGATRPVSTFSPGPRHSREAGTYWRRHACESGNLPENVIPAQANLPENAIPRPSEPTGERHSPPKRNPPENAIPPQAP